jgi:hypothetical protein
MGIGFADELGTGVVVQPTVSVAIAMNQEWRMAQG